MQLQTNDDDHPLKVRMRAADPPRMFLTPQELADYWAMATHTLANWRAQGIGPHFTKVGARILYAVDDVIRYEKTINPADK